MGGVAAKVGVGGMGAKGPGGRTPLLVSYGSFSGGCSPLICKREQVCDPGAGAGLGKRLVGGLFVA